MTGAAFLTESELVDLGLASHGERVLISRLASIHQPERFNLGHDVRIDDFAVLTAGDEGWVHLGSHVHISAFAALLGSGGITVDDYVALSARVSIFTTNDDYSGSHLTNPTVHSRYTQVLTAPVTVRKHAIVGAHSVILPDVCIGEGAAVGSLSLVASSLDAWGIYAGIPVRFVRPRSQALLSLEAAHRESTADAAGTNGV